MASFTDFISHNTGINFRRTLSTRSRRGPRSTISSTDRPTTPIALRPSIDTSTGIIAIRYSSSDTETDSPTSTTTQSSRSSERSFYIEASPTPEDSSGNHAFDLPSTSSSATRPSLPQRSASRRLTLRRAATSPSSPTSSVPTSTSSAATTISQPERPMTPPPTSYSPSFFSANSTSTTAPPPIPPKSPYRASRAMRRLHDEMVGMAEDDESVDMEMAMGAGEGRRGGLYELE